MFVNANVRTIRFLVRFLGVILQLQYLYILIPFSDTVIFLKMLRQSLW